MYLISLLLVIAIQSSCISMADEHSDSDGSGQGDQDAGITSAKDLTDVCTRHFHLPFMFEQ